MYLTMLFISWFCSVAEHAKQEAFAQEEELEKEEKKRQFSKEKMKQYEEDLKNFEVI